MSTQLISASVLFLTEPKTQSLSDFRSNAQLKYTYCIFNIVHEIKYYFMLIANKNISLSKCF